MQHLVIKLYLIAIPYGIIQIFSAMQLFFTFSENLLSTGNQTVN